MEEFEYARQKRLEQARIRQRIRNARPEVKAKNAAYAKEYTSRPEVKARLKEQRRERNRQKAIMKMIEKLRAAGYTVTKEET